MRFSKLNDRIWSVDWKRERRMKKLHTPLSNEHLRAIGKVVTNFAILEHEISWFIWILLGLKTGVDAQELAQILTSELRFRNLIDLFGALYRHRVDEPARIEELKSLLGSLNEASKKRNIIVHSIWGAGSTGNQITRIKTTAKAKKGLKWQRDPMNVREIDEIADFIGNTCLKLEDFLSRYVNTSS
jgi:hypothetical protein